MNIRIAPSMLALFASSVMALAIGAGTAPPKAPAKPENAGQVPSGEFDGAGEGRPDKASYRSPYRLAFHWTEAQLLPDAGDAPRNDPKLSGAKPHEQWYTDEARKKDGVWGPQVRAFDVPACCRDWPADRKRERVILVASRYLGYDYQHHHLPDWDPPKDWPWKKVAASTQSKGVDCSNFTSFVYNYALGLGISSDIHKQSDGEARGKERKPAAYNDGTPAKLTRIEKPVGDDAYAKLVASLRKGDLMLMTSRKPEKAGQVSHVAIFLGDCGVSPDKTPLIMDSAGGGTDCAGKPIPTGIFIRPMTPDSWYFRNFHHAWRVIQDDSSGNAPQRATTP